MILARNIATLAALAAALLSSSSASAQVSDDVVKIGVLTDMNGPASTPTGQGSVTAAQMAVDDFGGKVLGKPIEVIFGDHQHKPDIGAAHRAALVRHRTGRPDRRRPGLLGGARGAERRQREEEAVHHALDRDRPTSTASSARPTRMQWVFDTRALAVGTAQEVVKRGGDSWFFITDDYAFGHSLETDATAVIEANGGKVIGSVRPPFATPDLSSFVLQAQASKAKVIGIAGGPPNNTNEIKLAGEFGVFKGGQQMAGPAGADHRHPRARTSRPRRGCC